MIENIFKILVYILTQIVTILIAIGLGFAFKVDSSIIKSIALTNFCFVSVLFNILLSL